MGNYTFKGKAAVSVAAIAALALSGCAHVGGGGEENGGGEGEGQEGGVVTVAETNAFTAVNNATAATNLDINGKIANATREGFIYVNPAQEIVPNEGFGSYEKTSDDPLTVEYTLNDPEWSDGNAIDKADIILWWSILSGYHNDEDAEAETGTKYFNIAGSTDIMGKTDKPEFSEDGKSFTITYEEPQSDWEIAFDNDYLQPAHVVAEQAGMTEDELLKTLEDSPEGNPEDPQERPELEEIGKTWAEAFQFSDKPEDESLLVSNGPYKINDIVENNSVTLVKNDSYTGDNAGKLDEITVRTIGDATAQIQALRNGEVDIMAPGNVNKDTIDQVNELDNVEVIQGGQLAYDHLDLNFGADTFEDQAVREAFLKTVPRQQIVDQLIKPVNDEASVLNSQMWVTSQEEYGKTTEENQAEDLYGDVDIDGAKELLDGKTPTVRILYNNENPLRVDTFQLIKESAEQAGFKVEDLGDPNWSEKLADGDYDASLFGWVSPGVGTEMLSQIFKTGGGGNYNKYSNPEVDKLTDEARSNLDKDARDEQIVQIDKHTFEDGYGLPLFQSPGFFGVSDQIDGVTEYQPNQDGVFWNVWEWSRK